MFYRRRGPRNPKRAIPVRSYDQHVQAYLCSTIYLNSATAKPKVVSNDIIDRYRLPAVRFLFFLFQKVPFWQSVSRLFISYCKASIWVAYTEPSVHQGTQRKSLTKTTGARGTMVVLVPPSDEVGIVAGSLVNVSGLVSAAGKRMNGKCGLVRGPNGQGRFTVEILGPMQNRLLMYLLRSTASSQINKLCEETSKPALPHTEKSRSIKVSL